MCMIANERAIKELATAQRYIYSACVRSQPYRVNSYIKECFKARIIIRLPILIGCRTPVSSREGRNCPRNQRLNYVISNLLLDSYPDPWDVIRSIFLLESFEYLGNTLFAFASTFPLSKFLFLSSFYFLVMCPKLGYRKGDDYLQSSVLQYSRKWRSLCLKVGKSERKRER